MPRSGIASRAPNTTACWRELFSLGERYTPEDWNDGSVVDALRAFAARFRATDSEEGTVMAVTLEYVIEDLEQDERMRRLAELGGSERVLRLLARGVRERQALISIADDGGGARRGTLLSALNLSFQ